MASFFKKKSAAVSQDYRNSRSREIEAQHLAAHPELSTPLGSPGNSAQSDNCKAECQSGPSFVAIALEVFLGRPGT